MWEKLKGSGLSRTLVTAPDGEPRSILATKRGMPYWESVLRNLPGGGSWCNSDDWAWELVLEPLDRLLDALTLPRNLLGISSQTPR